MKLQDLKLEQVSQIYLGKDKVCRCGCAGDYVSTSFMFEPRSDVDDRKALLRLNRAKRLLNDPTTEVEYEDTFINVSYGDDRAITIYLDELK